MELDRRNFEDKKILLIPSLLRMMRDFEINLGHIEKCESEGKPWSNSPRIHRLNDDLKNAKKEGTLPCIGIPIRMLLDFCKKDSGKESYAFLHFDTETKLYEIQSEYQEAPLAPYLDDRCRFTLLAAQNAISRWLNDSPAHSVEITIASFSQENIRKEMKMNESVPILVELDQPRDFGTRKWRIPFELNDEHVWVHRVDRRGGISP